MKAQFGKRRPWLRGVAISLRRGARLRPTLDVRTDEWWAGMAFLWPFSPLLFFYLRMIMFVTSLSGWGEEGEGSCGPHTSWTADLLTCCWWLWW